MKSFENKIVLITGAGSGIGRALAIEFAKLGSHLILNDYNSTSLKETIELVRKDNTKVYFEIFDVSDADQFLKFAENSKEQIGVPHVIINNAGVSLSGKTFNETSLDDFHWLFNINFWGVVNGTKAFLPLLLKQNEAAIVNISSVFGLMATLKNAAYCASKFAVRGFTETLLLELADSNISVHSVHPGGINTNIVKAAMERSPEDITGLEEEFEKQFLTISPEVAAKTIIKGIRKKRNRILIGKEAYAIDFFSRLSPFRFMRFVNKSALKSVTKQIEKKA